MRTTLSLILTLWVSTSGLMAQHFDFNDRCMKAYDRIFELRFTEAESLLRAESSADPDNLIPVFLGNYIDFLSLFISEEDELFAKLEGNKQDRLSLLKKGDKSSPYFLYTQAEVHMQWAFARIKFGEYVKAFLEVRKAYKILNDNNDQFPDFKPNLKGLGVLHTLLGAIPDKYKFGAKVLGMKGSIPQGLAELGVIVKDKNSPFRDEAIIMYALLQLHLNKNETKAWDLITDQGLEPETNLLHCFAASSVAMYTGRNDEMIHLLMNRPSGPKYYPFPYLDYYLGHAKLYRLDEDADLYFKRYLMNYKGKNYIKEAYRKLSWHYLLQDNNGRYNYYTQMVLYEGQAVSDEDKAALADAKSGRRPHIGLLKARLLFDGAYYKDALTELLAIEDASLDTEWHKAEYAYRKARILDKLDRWGQAKGAYESAIEKGHELPTFFSANACIKLGNIYEAEKNAEQAESYYRKALTYRDHEYLNSIEAEAKAGLNRLK